MEITRAVLLSAVLTRCRSRHTPKEHQHPPTLSGAHFCTPRTAQIIFIVPSDAVLKKSWRAISNASPGTPRQSSGN